MGQETSFNRLGDEKSAYLLQHKDNPVHWWPYGPEALQRASDENKPIFLSVGYSSCHWCHVMAHESFENQDVANFLNENFINIKVDREEYPDLDSYYQVACQLFIQAGGWPLSAFLMPDMRPFFVGTYFPLNVRQEGGATFMELIRELNRAWKEEPNQVKENAERVTQTIADGLIPKDKVDFHDHFPAPGAIMQAIDDFADKENGGYGMAPKFPHFAFYEWCIEQMLEGMIDKNHGQHIVDTLEKMLMGGMADHARGGIHRYSTDEKFLVPHFEKMLYDQAGLIRLLAKFSLLYPSPLVFDCLINTLDYLKSEMQSESGIFFSAQDADSEGIEGLYFTYNEEEFEDLVKKSGEENIEKMDDIKKWFQVTKNGNFDHSLNVISLSYEKKDEIFTRESWDIIRAIRKEILEDRKNRIPPSTDNKGVASWNFMLVSALVDCMQYCSLDVVKRQANDLFNTAVEGLYKNFLISKDESGMKLRHTTTKESSLPYFEDYVMFAEVQLRIYEITANPIFKENFLDTLTFIAKEFIDGEKAFTRAKSAQEFELYPNQEINAFDGSFKSSLSTLIVLARRARILTCDPEVFAPFEEIAESIKHQALKNPVNAGEAMRACTYPDKAYRVVKVPAGWLQRPEYVSFINYFQPRFVLDYHRDENENWQICNFEACELQGEGLQNFFDTLRPPKKEEEVVE